MVTLKLSVFAHLQDVEVRRVCEGLSLQHCWCCVTYRMGDLLSNDIVYELADKEKEAFVV